MHASEPQTPDFTRLDDSALISRRSAMRAALGRLPPHSLSYRRLSAWYDLSTLEIDDRARKAWARSGQPGPAGERMRARLLAVEVLLADPEALGNDAMEGDLYILRDQLQAPTGTGQYGQAASSG